MNHKKRNLAKLDKRIWQSNQKRVRRICCSGSNLTKKVSNEQLEPENELYNAGPVDMSHKFEKMYVVRPQRSSCLFSLTHSRNKREASTWVVDIEKGFKPDVLIEANVSPS